MIDDLAGKTLGELTDIELLYAILKRNGSVEGPESTSWGGDVRESLIGVGKDHTVRIMYCPDDFEALEELVRGNPVRCFVCGAQHGVGLDK